MRAALLYLLALVAVAPSLAAQAPNSFQGEQLTELWSPSAPNSAPFGRSSTGEVTGNGTPDALLLDGELAVLLVDPDSAYAPVEVPGASLDACILPAQFSDGRGVIAAVSSAGLSAWSYDPTSGALSEHVLASGAWAGARAVRTADLDGSGRPDLVGVAADLRSVLVLLAGTGELAFNAAAGFEAVDDVLDIVPLQWDLDLPLELAVLSPSGLRVHDQSGVVCAWYTSILPGGTIARIRQQGQARDRLTWITAWAPPAQQWLLTLSDLGVEGQLDLGALDAVASMGADFDADGDDDLMISHRYSYDLVWLANRRSATQPLCESFVGYGDGTRLFRVGPVVDAALENRAWPALADFDRDGDIDVVFGCERTLSAVYLRGDWKDQGALRPGVVSANYAAGTLQLSVSAPAVVDPTATHLELDVWRRADPGSCVQGLGVEHVRIPLPAQWPAALTLALDEQFVFSSAHYIRIRAVQLSASGALTNEFPSYIGALAPTNAWVDALLAEEPSSALLPVSGTMPEGEANPDVVPRARTRRFARTAPPVSAALGS